MNANESLQKLKQGNQKYLKALTNSGDISPQIRLKTAQKGQFPFATIIACSDSREIPEAIFSAGIGDLFDIRIAGNVIDDHQLGSIEYAADHLKTPLVVVLGHTHCGAINAAITNHSFGFIKSITDDIKKAIGNEQNDTKASILNIQHNVDLIQKAFSHYQNLADIKVIGALYDIETRQVLWY